MCVAASPTCRCWRGPMSPYFVAGPGFSCSAQDATKPPRARGLRICVSIGSAMCERVLPCCACWWLWAWLACVRPTALLARLGAVAVRVCACRDGCARVSSFGLLASADPVPVRLQHPKEQVAGAGHPFDEGPHDPSDPGRCRATLVARGTGETYDELSWEGSWSVMMAFGRRLLRAAVGGVGAGLPATVTLSPWVPAPTYWR